MGEAKRRAADNIRRIAGRLFAFVTDGDELSEAPENVRAVFERHPWGLRFLSEGTGTVIVSARIGSRHLVTMGLPAQLAEQMGHCLLTMARATKNQRETAQECEIEAWRSDVGGDVFEARGGAPEPEGGPH